MVWSESIEVFMTLVVFLAKDELRHDSLRTMSTRLLSIFELIVSLVALVVVFLSIEDFKF